MTQAEAVPATIPEDRQTAVRFSETINTQLDQMSEGIPTLEDIDNAQVLLAQVQESEHGYRGPDAKFLAHAAVDKLKAVAEPETWKLDPQTSKELVALKNISDVTELPADTKRDFRLSQSEQVKKYNAELAKAKEEAVARLALDDSIRQRENTTAKIRAAREAGHRYNGQIVSSNRESATINADLKQVEDKARQEVLEATAGEVEAQKAAVTGDKLERHYKTRAIDASIQEKAQAAADKAVAMRKEEIAAAGGGVHGVKVAQAEEQKRAWQEHVGVGMPHERQVVPAKEESHDITFATDPTNAGMNYSEWLAKGGIAAAHKRIEKMYQVPQLDDDANLFIHGLPEPSETELFDDRNRSSTDEFGDDIGDWGDDAWTTFATGERPIPTRGRLVVPEKHDDDNRWLPPTEGDWPVAPYTRTIAPEVPSDKAELPEDEQPEIMRTVGFEQAMTDLKTARQRYAQVSAKNRSKVWIGKKHKERLETARQMWDTAREIAGMYSVAALQEAGATDEEILKFIRIGAVDELTAMTSATQREEIILNGRYTYSEERDEYVSKSRTKVGQQVNKFYDWWGKSGVVKKAAVTGIVGGAAGLVAIPILSAGVGTAVAAAGFKLTKNMAAARLNRKGGTGTVARQRSQATTAIMHDKYSGTTEAPSTAELADALDSTTQRSIKKNRITGVTTVASIAGGAVLGHVLHNAFISGKTHKPTAGGSAQGKVNLNAANTSTIAQHDAPTTVSQDQAAKELIEKNPKAWDRLVKVYKNIRVKKGIPAEKYSDEDIARNFNRWVSGGRIGS